MRNPYLFDDIKTNREKEKINAEIRGGVMKEITVTLYHFGELSDDSKEKAREYVRNNWDLYDWAGEENAKSFEELAKLFGGGTDYEYSAFYSRRNYARITNLPWYTDDPLESKEYLLDNASIIRKECPFTGYYMDEVILQPFRDYLDGLEDTEEDVVTIGDLCQEASQLWLKACIQDMEYCYSDEAVDDMLIINEYDFTVDGKLY